MKQLRRALLIGVLFLMQWAIAPSTGHSLLAATAQGDDPVLYLRYDVQIDVNEDGSFHVVEEQEILFNEAFRTAFAEIPLDYVSEIRNIQLSEGGTPFQQVSTPPSSAETYHVSYEQQAVFIEWMYEETTPGESRTFILEYDVIGGLWVYEDGDILEWRAVPADRSGVPVLSSTVTVTLPQAASAEPIQTNAFGPPFSVDTGDNRVIFNAGGEIADGTAFQIMVGFAHGVVDATVQPWQRAEDSAELVYSIPLVEAQLEIAPGGAIQVTESQTVRVDAGTLYGGQRTIPLAYVDGLADFSLSEGAAPYVLLDRFDETCESCAWLQEAPGRGSWIQLNRGMGTMIIDEEAAGHVEVGWTAPPLVKGEETTFVLRYTAAGALQVTSEAQVLAWTPVAGFEVPVESARMVVDLPPGVAAENVEVEGGVAEVQEGSLRIRRDGPLPAGEAWQVRLSLPPDATTSAKPLWQQEMERVVLEAEAIREEFRQQEIRRARQQLAFGVGGALLLMGGLLLVGLMWYFWGRDSETTIVPDYLSEPPSTLPPGIVAYLLDEKPTPKGVLASLFHLATLGLLRIELSDPLRLARNWEEELVEGQMIETSDGETVPIPDHMVQLFNGLRPHLATTLTPLSQITPHLLQLIPQVYYTMGEEATRFFAQLPGESRRRWLVYGQWAVLGGVGLALAAALLYVARLGWVATLPAIALVVVGAAMILVSRWMPRRSPVGVQEAARWRAFEQYLRNLKQYGDQEDAQRILDRHFAYAVALDVENVVLAQAEQMDTVMPTWTRPVVLYEPAPGSSTLPPARGPLRRRLPTDLPGDLSKLPGSGGVGQEGVERRVPSLAGLAETLSAQLERANAGLTRTLRQAVGDVGETPFELVWRGARGAGKLTWKATTTSLEIMEAILDEASSGGGSSSYRGSSFGGSGRSSRSSWGSSRSSGFGGRSSGSRRSGGGGSRGFGR